MAPTIPITAIIKPQPIYTATAFHPRIFLFFSIENRSFFNAPALRRLFKPLIKRYFRTPLIGDGVPSVYHAFGNIDTADENVCEDASGVFAIADISDLKIKSQKNHNNSERDKLSENSLSCYKRNI